MRLNLGMVSGAMYTLGVQDQFKEGFWVTRKGFSFTSVVPKIVFGLARYTYHTWSVWEREHGF